MSKLFGLLLFMVLLQSCSHDADKFEVKGIDISHYQKKIDWRILSQQPIDFVFVKATEGLSYRDSLFEQNWDALANTKFKRGAYHFFRPRVSVERQIQNFKNFVSLKSGDLPPVLDVEDIRGVTIPELIERINLWLTFIEEHYNTKPIIYTFFHLYQEHLKAAFPDHIFWVAHYSRIAPKQTDNWHFWQYSNRGTVQGISGAVDLNVFNGEISDLESVCLK